MPHCTILLVVVTILLRCGVFALCVWLIFHAFSGIAHAPDPEPFEGADVRQFSLTPWTHVGIAVRRDDELFIYHADPENGCLDHVTGVRNRTGAQLNSLREYAEQYMGEIYVRQMRGKRPSDAEFDAIMDELSVCKFAGSLKRMIRSVGGRNPLIPLLAPLRDKDTGHQHYFRSELAAHVFKRLGVMRHDLDERTYHPSSYAADEGMEIADDHSGFWPFVRPMHPSS